MHRLTNLVCSLSKKRPELILFLLTPYKQIDGIMSLLLSSVSRATNYVGGNSFGEAMRNGKTDELRIYNRPLSLNEIMNLMNYVN